MNREEALLERVKELHTYCKSPDFDAKLFAQKSKNFYDLYKRCDYATQGEYHYLWSEWLNNTDEGRNE